MTNTLVVAIEDCADPERASLVQSCRFCNAPPSWVAGSPDGSVEYLVCERHVERFSGPFRRMPVTEVTVGMDVAVENIPGAWVRVTKVDTNTPGVVRLFAVGHWWTYPELFTVYVPES